MTIFNLKAKRGHQSLAGSIAAAALMATTLPAFAEITIEQQSIEVAPASDSKRVYVTDPGHFQMTSQVFTIDGNNNKILGMVDAGKLPHVLVGDKGKFMAVANTWYDRIARGQRNDYIEVFDTQTHNVTADIDIPEGRFLTAVFTHMATLSTDDKHMLFQQFSPVPAVGLVDLEKNKFVKMMDTPDCYHLFPAPEQNVYMHCRDGSMMKIKYDDEGNSTQTHSKVFHPEDSYLVNEPYYSDVTNRLAWPDYEGRIYQATLSADGAKFMEPIDVFTEKEKAEKWRPGGWQLVTIHNDSNELYLLADQRGDWTHKSPSRYVFVVDANTGKRLRRIELKHEIDSIAVSQDDNPYLFAVSAGERTMYTFDAKTGKQIAEIGNLGRYPHILTLPQDSE
ncbi:methylamine dehydrogenase (amicyanin) large subunit [Methylophaga sp. OBS3]|uniref:methylamine dehydrogenase (amicyanin) large subunit n=1 Tax=Methylophaga sp. OBS3 TaxID=2991934 RepID=UPI00224CA0CC|nr:methylamine dehydrogenase (amicyanin) large subunit [Methylophaga sp. OBS3]MCX4190509.1 methylamine dehydrogenase (amicyanin) large subunit [Methylophaga sp. OBS3]